MENLIKCFGCGALVKDIPGQPHKYIGATAGCWEVYGEILAKEYGEYGYPEPTHRLTVDTYAVQHPGRPSRQAAQSVNVHLISLHLVLEQNMSGQEATRAIGKILQRFDGFEWSEPPVPNGQMTVLDIVKAKDITAHQQLVDRWARDVWKAWASHHGQIYELIQRYLK